MEIPKQYEAKAVEDKWYRHWMERGYFRSVPDEREPYTVVIPPPNVTGVLHMGHMLNNTIQDVLVRRARMQGKNACWVPAPTMPASPRKPRWCACSPSKGIKKSAIGRENSWSMPSRGRRSTAA
jgi:valyl-tRNA synthetase